MTMITLPLNQQDEYLLLQAVQKRGISIEQFILQSMRKEAQRTENLVAAQDNATTEFLPNAETLKAIESARRGEVEHYATYDDMMKALSE